MKWSRERKPVWQAFRAYLLVTAFVVALYALVPIAGWGPTGNAVARVVIALLFFYLQFLALQGIAKFIRESRN